MGTNRETLQRTIFRGKYIGEAPYFTNLLERLEYLELSQNLGPHPRTLVNIDGPRDYEETYGIDTRVARVDRAVHEQLLLAYALLVFNPGLTGEILQEKLNTPKAFLQHSIDKGDLSALRLVPNLLLGLLAIQNIAYPPEDSDYVTYHPERAIQVPLDDAELQYLQEHPEYTEATRLVPRHIAVALIGLASFNLGRPPVYYTKTSYSTRTLWRFTGEIRNRSRRLQTSHHALVFPKEGETSPPRIFRISPVTGTILELTGLYSRPTQQNSMQ